MAVNLELSQKFQAGLALLVVFLLVLATNRLDNRHFTTVQSTVNSVFEDRVVAQDYIYRLNNLFQKKRLFIAVQDSMPPNVVENTAIDELLGDFENTSLTANESLYFKELKDNFDALLVLEESALATKDGMTKATSTKLKSSLQKIMVNLDDLAQTQLSEGRQLTDMAKKSLEANNLLSNLEIGFLIVIGIILQVVIFYPNKRTRKNEA